MTTTTNTDRTTTRHRMLAEIELTEMGAALLVAWNASD